MPQQQSEPPRPPGPPEFGRAFDPAPSQLVGVGVMAVLVLLALLGLFGNSSGRVTAREGPLALDVTHPQRMRYKTLDAIDVEVANTGASDLGPLTVRFDRKLIDAFSNTSFTPGLTSVSDESYDVALDGLPAGETRMVTVAVQAEAYWRHSGFVEVRAPGATVRATLSALVFP